MTETTVSMSPAAYTRWIEAQRPPFEWFMQQPEADQDLMAEIGADYMRDLILGIQVAILGEEPNEEDLAKEVAAALVQKLTQKPSTSPPRPSAANRLSMAGIGDRRSQRGRERQESRNAGRRLLGREPDEVAAK